MITHNFRSLLLVAIVISNCITWTASRHNDHQHHTRPRRQGLDLPASYVIPGGEGSGPWGDWGDISPCSRTCGGGVASQKRVCLEPRPQNSCTGGDTKYFSCQTQDCPAGSGDFRAEQCAEFNDKEFRGYKYKWVPYTKAPNPCELNCMPHAEQFYFRHKQRVADGTRCNEDSLDVCVNGVCQHVGCDMMLGSSASEDKCRECRGNGTNCHTMEGLFDCQDLLNGYNDILLIPKGSTTIIIEEIEPSNNYLALRSINGTYYLNGDYHIDFSRSIMIAGALWTYERSQQGFPAPDKLRCLGPITEPLYLSLLRQDENVGIKYEFSVPNRFKMPNDQQYNWVHEEYTPCSATCGRGFQTRNVTCRSKEELEVVDNKLCDEGVKPPTNQSCNQDPCPAQWAAGPWGDCSKSCGRGGVKSREVICQKVITNGTATIVPDKECLELLGMKPEVTQKCNEDVSCPVWFVGQWKSCDKLCDEGKQTRQVVCRQKINGRVTVLGDGNCTDEKPTAEQKCMIRPCDGVDWVTSNWSECDTCISKRRTRRVLCLMKHHATHIRVNDSFCSHHPRPVEQEECDRDHLSPSEAQWHTTEWSNCSMHRGDTLQTRRVFCGVYKTDSVEQVEESNCAHLLKCNDTKPCSKSKEEYPLQWFTGPWSSCSKDCGGGEQNRRVVYMRGFEEAAELPWENMPSTEQSCNTEPCNPAIINPKHISSVDEKKPLCNETTFGCCPDNRTPSLGPFDQGCGKPRTCYESTYGCCPDGVSPKLGDTDEGCPVEACADTLFGCCLSDDKTAAQGNDQEGCPPPPPACATSEFGCYADNETKAVGHKTTGFPETETSTTVAGTETTTETTVALEMSEGSTTGADTRAADSTEVGSTTLDLCSGSEFGCCSDNQTEAKGPDGQGCPCTEYRLMSDGTLEIVSLYRNDTGNYICVAGNGLGVATQEIHLVVNDPVRTPAKIAGDENTIVIGELGSPLSVRCLANGYPSPFILWFRGNELSKVLYSDDVYEARGKVLLIRNLTMDTLGQYTCQAYNGEGKMALWVVNVHASRPRELFNDNDMLVPRETEAPTTTESTDTHIPVFNEMSITETSTDTAEALKTSVGSTTGADTTAATVGSTTLDLCSGSEFGCCADNQTEAKGPDGHGCPCNATEFGCCPDGISPATGADSEGCPGPCSTSPHGCCEDNKTPAHGPNFEGCCLLHAFGCCPDNRKPAERQHLEGCGCQYSLHGCCPDNVTIAQGADNLGCGCQYTQHGCCPDRHTAASSPNNEGCGCSTYQFGCCPDGVTIAKGPEQLGCHCHYSFYGCCGDGVTPATGPDAAGCDCSSSKHGCCPDGTTEAAGPKFLECTDVPENKQAACSLPTDPGSCLNFTAMWYFDMTYGGCSRFWYGGCEANGNVFATKEDCEDVCVQPSPKEVCNLPSVKGACDDNFGHWYYNSTREQCVPFLYGGCLGNANNFKTKELCQKQCDSKAVKGQCDLPIEQGSCAGNFSRWGFNPDTRSCEQFIWGGCEGNSNRFNTEAACQMRCNPPGSPPPQCAEPQEAGSCSNKEALWSFSVSENRCVPFYYSGCGGNNNRFPSREACEQTCPAAYVPDKCTLPAETGQCSNYRERWFFDTTFKRCRQFYYGGCGGNENNFPNEEECENSCSELTATTTTATTTNTVRPAEPRLPPGPKEPSRPETTEVDDCGEYVANCSRLRCKYILLRTRMPNGCYMCSCLFGKLETDCTPLINECETIECTYGIQITTESDGCQRCSCKEYPCKKKSCPPGDRCVVIPYKNDTDLSTKYTADCRTDVPEPPQALPLQEPQVTASEGCKTVLRCLFYGNPPPKITWRHGKLNIVGSTGRYRLMSDGALEIVSLYRNDTGVYICVADNGLGVATQEIHLVVNATCGKPNAESCDKLRKVHCGKSYGNSTAGNLTFDIPIITIDPVETPTVIAGHQNAVVIGELGNPFSVRCVAYGYPPPTVTWHRVYNGTIIPVNNVTYEAKGDVLLIRSLAVETLGQYICHAYNGLGKAALWVVNVRAYRPEGLFTENEMLVPRETQDPTTTESIDTHMPMFTETSITVSTTETAEGLETSERSTTEADTMVASSTEVGSTTLDLCNGFEFRCCANNQTEAKGPDGQRCPCNATKLCDYEDLPAPPQALPQKEAQVAASEGGKATLRCPFHGSPPPKITWRHGELNIDGSAGRYRLMSDGTLEIVSLYRNDTGNYICVADNSLGVATQEIHLVVNDPVVTPVRIAGDKNAVVIGELGSPLSVRCLAYGYPPPTVFWYYVYNGTMVPFINAMYEARGKVLLIRNLAIETLGQYMCQAYNGVDEAAWVVNVRAYRPEGLRTTNDMLVPRDSRETQVPTAADSIDTHIPVFTETSITETTTNTAKALETTERSTTGADTMVAGSTDVGGTTLDLCSGSEFGCCADNQTEAKGPDGQGCPCNTTELCNYPKGVPSMPVSVHVTASTTSIGKDLKLTCEVDGYPEPDVYWTKDGVRLENNDRILITGNVESELTVQRVTVSDSGLYACHASNLYSSGTDTAQVNVKQVYVPPKCTDNPFFANCVHIVRSNFCAHKYYKHFCCKSCVEAGQIAPPEE
ncbi:papilin-like isoform X2 [Spodoptera litura]|uniref:Hemolin n=1 Tax=Spodoptera litura TaxID=69820 RepID=A0A9J7DVL3_SPOLT|nr:papilin-like isoform X2 [Spodoptera litura]